MKFSRSLAIVLRVCVGLVILAGLREAAHAQVEITEFMASNSRVLRDQDGDYPDWIEIHNVTASTVNLDGWSLTDDPSDLSKWDFPATNLFANGYLVVFASGKDRAVAGAELHTSFNLSADGEYLALVKPDGSIASEFAEESEQFEDISYGIGQNIQVTTLVSNAALVRVFIPTNGPAPGNWASTNFDDSTWLAGTNGVGYENFVSGFAVRNFKANVGVNSLTDAENIIVTPSMQSAVFTETRNVVNYLNSGGGAHYAGDYTVPGFTINVDVEDYVIEATGVVTIPASGNWTFGVNSDDGFGLTVGGFTTSYPSPRGPGDTLATFNFPAAGDYPIRLVFYERGGGSEVELFAAQGSFAAWNSTNFRLVGDSGNGGLAVKSNPIFGGSAISFRSSIRTDVQTQMLNKASTAYVRIPFSTTNAGALSSLTLQVKYDDGFVAFLNGTEIARRNVPASVQWNSTAPTARSNALALVFEDINVSPYLGLLQNGSNVLAFHAVNESTNSSDFLILVELSEFKTVGLTNHYFATPSPGGPNTSNYFAFVADTKFSQDRGFYQTNFSVTITSATPAVTIRYTTNCSAPSETNGFLYTGPISITGTTVLRARGYRTGFEPSDIDTQTYIFLDQVLTQTGAGFPTNWGAWLRTDYEMDPNVVNDPAYSSTIKNDLKAVSTMSLVVDTDQMFGPGGIYSNPTGEGVTWERSGSLEFIHPSGGDEFQVNCGVRVQGGASRDPNNSPKHGFRVLFKEIYGPTKLKFPLFPGSPVEEFDTFDFHAAFNDSWVWVSNPQGQYIRDVWCRDTQLDMGRISPHGTYVHLYVNGLYWGLYQPGEKPDASFAAHYFGGDKTEYDALNSSELIDGDRNAWNTMMSIAAAGITNDAAYAAIQQYLDIPSFIDYMLINLYAANTDWPWHNWTAARRRVPGAGFEFFSWDAEWIFSDVNANVNGVNSADTPGILYAQLRAHPEFRQLFADHVQRHFFNGGVLTPAAVDARWMKRATEIDRAIVGESARWGDYKQEPAFTRNAPWLAEQNRLRTQFFPQRTAIVLQQFRNIGLFPSVNAPAFTQSGGSVPPGFQLYITNLNATGNILFTLDGSDPRLPGGNVSPAAQTYTGPITLNVHTVVRARVKDGATWSAIVEGTFYTIQDFTKLRLTEIMYNPPGTTNVDGEEFEFLELKNTGTLTLDLSGLYFSSGIGFTFTNNTLLAPGQFFVLARNSSQFQARYSGVSVNGIYTGKLDNGGEKLAMSHVLGGVVLSLTYSDALPWPLTADGFGFSLVPSQTAGDLSEATSWRASAFAGGSPGADDPIPNIAPIVLNEVLTHSDTAPGDQIEIYNPTAQTVDISGWFLTDEPAIPKKFRVPNGTTLEPGGFYVFSETDFNATPGTNNSFALSSLGEQILLLSGDANTNLTGYGHGFKFGAAATNVSFGRYITSVGEEHFPPQLAQTFDATNAGPRVGPIVINEIMYHPEAGYDEFVELKNITAADVPLFDPDLATNTWKISGLNYVFPPNITLSAGSFLLVVPTDPALFRAKYGVPGNVSVLGPFAGTLQDSGERLELKRPSAPAVDSQGQIVIPFITVDEVRYNDKAPWPLAADGEGPSLQRLDSAAYGDDPTNWFASGISPGSANVFNSAPLVSIASPTNGARFSGPVTINIAVEASDTNGNVIQVEIFANGARLATLTNAPYTLAWPNVGPGSYTLTAKAKDNGFAATISSPVLVTVTPPPVGNGTGLTGEYYDNIDFTGTKLTRIDPTVNFNWGGASPDPIIGADSFSVRWTGLVQPRFTGQYTFYTTSDDGVRLWVNNQLIINNWTDHGTLDDLGVITLNAGVPYDIRMDFYENGGGAVAALNWTPPGLTREVIPTSQLYPFTNSVFRITRQPQSTNVLRGQTAVFSVTTTGFNPQTFQWYFNDTNLIAGATTATLTLTNVQGSAAGTYRVLVSDSDTNLLSNPATLNVWLPPVVVSPTNIVRQTIMAGDTIVLSTTTTGTMPMSYDWRRNFLSFTNIITNANTCTITVTNVQPASPGLVGSTNTYLVRLTNIAGALLSSNALIKVLNPPIITNQPVSQTTGAGSNVTFTVGAKGGTARRQWYQDGTALADQTNASLNLTNVQIANEGTYFVTLTNLDGMAASTNVVLVLDSDRDGLPDSWEAAHGLNATNSNDAAIDSDGDTMSNTDEYIAGTDPQDPQSYLRIDVTAPMERGVLLSFIAMSNRTYSVLFCTNAPSAPWSRLTNIEPAMPTNRMMFVTNALNAEAVRTYRLTTPKLP